MKIINILSFFNLKALSKKNLLRLLVENSIKDYPELSKNEFKELTKSIINDRSINETKNIVHIDDFEIFQAYEKAQRIIETSNNLNIKIISIFDDIFPDNLKQITSPPIVLYLKGNVQTLNNETVAVIGTRKPIEFSKENARKATQFFVKNNIVIVSGLALGIDSEAHKACINQGGKTIAVLPSSLDDIVPRNNLKLAQAILENDGMLLSEYPVSTKPQKFTYVERDRLESALSSAVIIIETEKSGGTMHAAKFALRQKKIIACFGLNNGYPQQRFSGNLEIINHFKSIVINNIEDLEKVINGINYNQCRNDSYEQLNF